MEVTVNQQNYHLEPACSVSKLLSLVLSDAPKGIAVAINQNIISKANWPDHILKNGDQVILIKATQGG